MLYDKFQFEWDERKDTLNKTKHGVSFAEASTTWLDPLSIEIFDSDHSTNEERWIRMGYSSRSRLLVTIFSEISETKFRIISSRKATANEARSYYER